MLVHSTIFSRYISSLNHFLQVHVTCWYWYNSVGEQVGEAEYATIGGFRRMDLIAPGVGVIVVLSCPCFLVILVAEQMEGAV